MSNNISNLGFKNIRRLFASKEMGRNLTYKRNPFFLLVTKILRKETYFLMVRLTIIATVLTLMFRKMIAVHDTL